MQITYYFNKPVSYMNTVPLNTNLNLVPKTIHTSNKRGLFYHRDQLAAPSHIKRALLWPLGHVYLVLFPTLLVNTNKTTIYIAI